MRRQHSHKNGKFEFQLELIKENTKSGCLFIEVDKWSGDIRRIIRPNANAFWVDGTKHDLFAVNYEGGQYTTTYRFFPFGCSGRWELMPFSGASFKPHKSYAYRNKYVGPKRGPSRLRRMFGGKLPVTVVSVPDGSRHHAGNPLAE